MAYRKHIHWGPHGLKVFFIVILVDCTLTSTENLSIWDDSQGNSEVFNIKLTEKSNWWDAAGRGCVQDGGHMYIPWTDSTLPTEVTRRLAVNTRYWVGAVQNSVWKWTSDESPVYSYMGNSNPPDNKPTRIQGNSVFRCHLHCVHSDKRVFGLRGDECYCLSDGDTSETTIREDLSIVRCAGNYEEYCGGDAHMSVYTLETIIMTPKANGQCAYVVKYNRNELKFFQDHNCNSKRYVACHKPANKPTRCRENVCTLRKSKTWEDATDYCRLLKVTSGNINSLLRSISRSNPSSYWVGLKREFSWRWINGSSVLADYDNMGQLDTCLAVFRSRGSTDRVNFVWMPCRNKYQAICQTAVKITPHPATSTTTITNTGSVGTSYTRPESNDTTTVPDPQTAGVAGGDNTGGYVGAAFGCIIAVGICVAVIVVMQRKKKFCFAGKSSSPKSGTKFNGIGHNNDGPYYSTPASLDVTVLPTARVKPNIHVVQNNIKDNAKSNSHNDVDDNYYSTLETTDAAAAAVPTAVVSPNNHKHEPLYVNSPKLSKESEYNTFMDTDVKAPSNHAYNHVYAGKDLPRHQGTYDHASPTGVCSPAGEVDQQHAGNVTYTQPAIYCELLNEPEYHIAGSPHRSPHGEDVIYDEARPEHPPSHPALYSIAAQMPTTSGRSEGRAGANRIYSVLDNSAMNENMYRHIGDNAPENTVHNGSQVYSLAAHTDTTPAQTVQGTGSDTEYLLQGSVNRRDTGIDNFYSLANDTSNV